MNSRQCTPEQSHTIEALAKNLHRHYRAGEKALGLRGSNGHDHGWDACSKQRYFRQRAVRELRGDVDRNQATAIAEKINASLEFIGVDFTMRNFAALVETTKHVEELIQRFRGGLL